MAEYFKRPDITPIDLRGCYPLARLRWIIRGYVLLEGVILAAILGCLWFWFSIALDYGLHHFFRVDLLDAAPAVRWATMAIFAIAIVFIAVIYILRRLFRDFSPAALALVLEKRFPALLGDRLITAVELSNLKRAQEQGYSVDMIVKTMRDAKERVDQVPVRAVFNWRRLVLLVWTLIGVSAVALLLTYPVSVLIGLVDRPRERATWMMLAVNALVIACVALAFFTPYLVAGVRRAGAGWRWSGLAVGVLCAAAAALGFKYMVSHVNQTTVDDHSWNLYHASDIGAQRNLFFAQTRWPRDEYFVEWFDFPVDQKRVQVNKTMNAKALFTTWIIADGEPANPWRPLRWADLPRFVDAKQVPELPIGSIQKFLARQAAGDERSPAGFDKKSLRLPGESDISVDLALASIQGMLAEIANDPSVAALPPEARAKFAKVSLSLAQDGVPADTLDRLEPLIAKLKSAAIDPKSGGRLLRQVAPPSQFTLRYGDETSQRGQREMARSALGPNVYELADRVRLDNSFASAPATDPDPRSTALVEKKVRLLAETQVAGKSLRAEPRQVVLVNAPKLQQIVYQEARPAYYYYLPPTGPRADTIDERRQLLRKHRQPLPKMPFASPPDSFTLPEFTVGSEVEVAAVSDKPLQEVTLTPRSAEFPGVLSKDDLAPVTIPIAADGRSFTLTFGDNGSLIRDLISGKAAGAPRFALISKPITFDLTLKDIDNMVSTQAITARPIDDKPPSVSLFVDVIRQVKIGGGTVYVCTPRADIPFAPESVIADENGLHKVEFTYDYSPIVSSAYVPGMVEQMAWLFNSMPALPNLGDYIVRREILLRTTSTIRDTIERDMPASIRKLPSAGAFPIAEFDTLQTRTADRPPLPEEELVKRFSAPLPANYVNPFVKKFTFKDLERPLSFDLEKMLPQLREKNAANLVPNYRLTIDTRATDSNVVAESPRVGRNAETLEFRIVGNDELYGYISKEEAELVRRFTEMTQKLEEEQKKLQGTVNRVGALSESSASFEQTRLEGVMDAVASSRVTISEIYTSYKRIQREYEANRFPEKLSTDLSKKIVGPIGDVQAREFPNADRQLSNFHGQLKSGRPDLAQPAAVAADQAFFELLEALRRIQKEMGDSIGFNKLVLRLQKVAEGQNLLSQDDLERLKRELQEDLLHIRFVPVPETVTVDAGKSMLVTLKLKMPKTITVDPAVRFEIPANSGLKIEPSEVALADDAAEAKFTLSAGAATGTFFIKVIPSQGNSIELKVVVK